MNKNLSNFKKTAMVSALLLEISTGVQAANIAVDGTTCTLADAVTAANSDMATGGCASGAGDDVLDLDIAGSPFTQTSGLSLTTNVTINGNGSTVERDNAAPEFSVFSVSGGANVVMNEVTVTGGNLTANNIGGGIIVQGGVFEINDSVITGNNGGGILFIYATNSSINNTVISNNTSNPVAYYGSGVTMLTGDLEINNSTITGNNNYATSSGGAAIYTSDFAGAVTLGVSNSTISGNTSVVSGGGISSKGYGIGIELNLNNVTLTLNSSQGNGGGMYNSSTDIAVSQSLLSGNTAAAANQWEADGASYVTVDAYNIFGESSASGLTGVTPGTYDIVPTVGVSGIFDTNLTDNGGQTPTHALITAGPAVDAVPNCLFGSDQTGKSRPIDGNADGSDLCDVGAFENENPDVIFKDGFN